MTQYALVSRPGAADSTLHRFKAHARQRQRRLAYLRKPAVIFSNKFRQMKRRSVTHMQPQYTVGKKKRKKNPHEVQDSVLIQMSVANDKLIEPRANPFGPIMQMSHVKDRKAMAIFPTVKTTPSHVVQSPN